MALKWLLTGADEHYMLTRSRSVRWRARGISATVLLGASLGIMIPLLSSGGVDASPTCSVSSELVPSCGVLWGAHAPQGWASFESMVGRKLAIVHDYTDWPSTFPSASEQSAASGDRIIYVDWTARDYKTGAPAATWAQIASGAQDSEINAEAAALKAFGKPIMVTFQAEPEKPSESNYGTAADFVAAWQHIHNVFAVDGVTNVVWVWTVTGDVSAYGSSYSQWYPGDGYVDWIMWDPYNWDGCSGGTATWRSFSDIVSPMYNWLTENSGLPGNGDYLSKPWGLAEFGTVEGATPTAKQQWFEDAVTEAQSSFPNLKALVYFNDFDQTNGRTCNWQVNTSADSLAGFEAAGDSSYASTMAGDNPPITTSTTTTTIAAVTTTTTPPVSPPPVTTLPPTTAPTITKSPQSVSLLVGERWTFQTAATGTPSPTVYWQISRNGGTTWYNMFAHTNPNYTVVSATSADNGIELRAVYTNSAGSAKTAPAVITIEPATSTSLRRAAGN